MKERILIIKTGGRGDVVRTTALLMGLKEKHPESEIWWLTLRDRVWLLRNNEFVDKIVAYSEDVYGLLKNYKFDIILSLEDGLEFCTLATKLGEGGERSRGGGRILGYYVENGRIVPSGSAREMFEMSILGESPKNDVLKKKNKKTYQRLLFDIAEIKPKHSDIIFGLTERQKRFAEDFARRYNISTNKDLVIGMNTGGGDRWPKEWSVKNTAKLADIIHKKLGAKVILFGGPNEIYRNNQIISLSKSPIINAGCGNNFLEFPALLSLCDLVVTSDTMGLHMALGLKRKVVVLIGPTSANELELYNLGTKMTPKKKCKCFYQNKCTQKIRCIDTISPSDVFEEVKKLVEDRICVVVSSFREPNLGKMLESLKKQNTPRKFDIIVSAGDSESEKTAKGFRGVQVFKDPGKGKSFALNLLMKKTNYDIMLFTDADVILDENAVEEMVRAFKNPLFGCVAGRPVAMDDRKSKFGYWAHFLYDIGAHEISRKKRFEGGKFLECSGYLFGFRGGIIDEIPLDVAEDSYIPYIFWKKKYKIGYAENAKVYVRNPTGLKEWMKQRVRTAKAHETLTKYAPDFPRVKSFFGEVIEGAFHNFFKVWGYPRNLREIFWTKQLFLARLYLWMRVFWDTRVKKKHYQDAWERVESTK